ncbi:MAG: hypothetical protein ACOX1Y_08860 [Zhaonellaceae bacterium]|jgi:hypothetical protein|nr:hypothetical protein [Clostridia bacterium]
MVKKKKENIELFIKQGKAYQELLRRTNPKKNQAKIREIEHKIALISGR